MMQLALGREIRVEDIEGEALVLDRSGAVVHHVSGDAAEALALVRRGIDEANVPAHLVVAMAELVDAGVVRASDWSRRKLLKAGGASLAGAAIITVGLASPVAAASGTATAGLRKSGQGNSDPTLTQLCLGGAQANAQRGSTSWTRTEGPALIAVTITLSTGSSATGREIYILQSTSSSACVGGTTSLVGVWAAVPANGPQTFFAPIVNSATRFVVAMQLSGGGGNDGSSSTPVNLP